MTVSPGELEAALLSGILSGDEAAVQAFVDRYRPRLESLARRLGARHPTLQDSVAKTLSEAVLQIRAGQYRGDASPGTWLVGILRRIVSTQLSREHRERGFVRLDAPDRCDTGLSIRATQELRAAVREALSRLPRLHRTVLYLNQIQGFTTEQIASRLKRRPGTIGKVLWQAKSMFADVYGAEEHDRVRRLKS